MSAALLGLLLAAAPVGAAQPQPQTKGRTLARMVSLAMARGKDHTLTEVGAAALGLNKTPTPLKSLKSGATRAFSVAYRLNGDKKIPAAIILWRMEQGSSAGPGLKSRNRSFLVDLKGRLACVYENRVGLDGGSNAIQIPKPGPLEQGYFQKEMDYWLHHAIPAEAASEGSHP